MLDFTIITADSVMNDNCDIENHVSDIDNKLSVLGFNYCDNYMIHFFDDDYMDSMDIETAISYLAIKEGFDLVQFSNGNYGIIGYYGNSVTGFEFIA